MKQKTKPTALQFLLAGMLGLAIGAGIWAAFRPPATSSDLLASRRGTTVERLRVIRQALENYRQQHGKLPAALTDLGLKSDQLLDGAGKPFLYPSGKAPAPVGRVIVKVSEPVAHVKLGPDRWAYAIVEDSRQKLFIHATTRMEELSP